MNPCFFTHFTLKGNFPVFQHLSHPMLKQALWPLSQSYQKKAWLIFALLDVVSQRWCDINRINSSIVVIPKEGLGCLVPAKSSFWYDNDKDHKTCFWVTWFILFYFPLCITWLCCIFLLQILEEFVSRLHTSGMNKVNLIHSIACMQSCLKAIIKGSIITPMCLCIISSVIDIVVPHI